MKCFKNHILRLIVIVVVVTVSNPVSAQAGAGLAQTNASMVSQTLSLIPYYLMIILMVGYGVYSFYRKEDEGSDTGL